MSTAYGTVNRRGLLGRAKRGELIGKCDFKFTDDYAFDNDTNFGKTGWLPVRIRKNHEDFEQGYLNLDEHCFKSKTGAAWYEDEHFTTVGLCVHVNLYYTLRIKDRPSI